MSTGTGVPGGTINISDIHQLQNTLLPQPKNSIIAHTYGLDVVNNGYVLSRCDNYGNLIQRWAFETKEALANFILRKLEDPYDLQQKREEKPNAKISGISSGRGNF